MPNWCDNTISISGPAEKVSQMYQQLNDPNNNDGLCQILYPMPENTFTGNLGEKERKDCAKQGIPNWYDWCTSNWGTKWDTADGDWQYEEAGDGEAILSGSFQTAWGPPIGAYENAPDDLYIEAMYYEPGCAFAGRWDSGNGDEHYSLEGDKAALENDLPEELNDAFGITENMEDEPEELSEWMREGAEAKKELVSG
jgi:hypothetical protein